MLKKLSHPSLFFLITVLIICSCTISRSSWRSGNLTYHKRTHFTKVWTSVLNEQKDAIFHSWCDWIEESPDWYTTYENEFSPDDIPSLQMIPILVYSIDFASLSTFNYNAKLDRLLQLDTSRCRYFIKNNNEFISIVECRYGINNGLEIRRMSGFPKGGEQIARDYMTDGKDVFFLNVYLAENGKNKKELLVCKDGDDFKTIGQSNKVKLLKDVLEMFRNSLGKNVIL